MPKQVKLAANNKKARHDYFIDETFEAGIVLTGTEIKSVRNGKVNIRDSYIRIENGEAVIIGMHISPYEQGNIFNVDPMRKRKLLLHRKEIRKLGEAQQQDGMALIPLKMYINGKGLAKMEIAIARGKKLYDKRADMAKKDADRKMRQARRK
ncbi:MAG: SsrA-binding protein SmpB [Anaerovoracaceae bacterium]|jgi:SsrA-binding protein